MLPGGRADIRDRSVTVAMHMLRRVLLGESDERPARPAPARPTPPSDRTVSEERVRLFVALELPTEVRSALRSWAAEHVGAMARLRLVEPESLHVTLCFLGWRAGGGGGGHRRRLPRRGVRARCRSR